jgi:hypothetical protein
MRLLTKEFYTLAELQAAWDMPDQDVYYLAMSGQLKLTFMVHDTQVRSPLPLMHYRNREVGRNYSGILDLKVRDADTILKAGSAEVWMFEMPNGDDGRLVSVDDKILVRCDDLLVTHDQREHVERNILKLNEPASKPVPIEFEYSWDYRRVELGSETFSLGPKQARIVGLLHRAYMEGDPWRTGRQLLDHAGSSADRVRDLFKSQSDWTKLIVSDGRGLYRLAIPTCSSTPQPTDLRAANPRVAAG